MFKRTVAQRPRSRNSISRKENFAHLESSWEANHESGNEEENPALEEKRATQEPPYKIESEEQSAGKSISETRRPSLSKSGGQHERRQKTAERKIKKQTLIDARTNFLKHEERT